MVLIKIQASTNLSTHKVLIKNEAKPSLATSHQPGEYASLSAREGLPPAAVLLPDRVEHRFA
jgi:hypothetical protein